ncbi:T9SS type A sorting domain-containing protein [candidate division KSB1 bacterium]|nr:T9SS type A sorting domain-containing protein [candidate division KSB1 bacterium]
MCRHTVFVLFFFLKIFIFGKILANEPPPVAHWSFDQDSAGIIQDKSGNKLHGNAYNISYGRGVIGNAVLFNSPTDEIHIPARGLTPPSIISNLTQGSISVWFKYQSVGSAILPILYFGEADKGTPHNSLIIEIGHGDNPANRKLYFTIVNQRFCYDSGENLQENEWYHFVAVVSETGNTGYLNGKLMNKRHYNLGSDSTYTKFFASVPVQECLSIGYGRYGQNDNFFHFKGMIDEVRIYDRPLTASEIKTLYIEGTQNSGKPIPTFENISYGPYERNVLDFWQASSSAPTPVVIFIHGGGFVGGDKSSVALSDVSRCLEQGVSFAAINYRFRTSTRLDTIMLDCARAIQFLRAQAAVWNIDQEKIAAYGGSAGGGASIWVGFHDDLADPDNADPVLRESTRLTVIGHKNSQATYDCEKWAAIVGVDVNWREEMGFIDDLEFLGIADRSYINDPGIVTLRQQLDMLLLMDSGDPPVYLHNLAPDSLPVDKNRVIHHPRHAKYLKARCDSLGIEAALVTAATAVPDRVDMLDFFFKYLFSATDIQIGTMENPGAFILHQNYPNPFNPTTTISFYLPHSGPVQLRLFDLLGREVKTILNREMPTGAHSVKVDLTDLSGGIYFYSLMTNGFTEVKKCIFLK